MFSVESWLWSKNMIGLWRNTLWYTQHHCVLLPGTLTSKEKHVESFSLIQCKSKLIFASCYNIYQPNYVYIFENVYGTLRKWLLTYQIEFHHPFKGLQSGKLQDYVSEASILMFALEQKHVLLHLQCILPKTFVFMIFCFDWRGTNLQGFRWHLS